MYVIKGQEPYSSVALPALIYEENQGSNPPSPIVVTIKNNVCHQREKVIVNFVLVAGLQQNLIYNTQTPFLVPTLK
jgi:hypothetical protein